MDCSSGKILRHGVGKATRKPRQYKVFALAGKSPASIERGFHRQRDLELALASIVRVFDSGSIRASCGRKNPERPNSEVAAANVRNLPWLSCWLGRPVVQNHVGRWCDMPAKKCMTVHLLVVILGGEQRRSGKIAEAHPGKIAGRTFSCRRNLPRTAAHVLECEKLLEAARDRLRAAGRLIHDAANQVYGRCKVQRGKREKELVGAENLAMPSRGSVRLTLRRYFFA